MDPDQRAILQLFEHRFGGTDNNAGIPITFPTSGGMEISTRTTVTPANDPELGYATTIQRGVPFSTFSRPHRRAAKDLCNFFMKTGSPRELAQLAMKVRGRVNDALFIYAISFVILRKPELRKVRIPSLVEIFPDKFAQQEMLVQAQNQVNKMSGSQKGPVMIINEEFSGTLLKAEHRVSYWREDYGINSHHWHWHLVFPVEMELQRDRKGELFYFMHQQMLARYDMERLSVGLNRVLPLNSFRVPIEDGYFSKLTVNNSGSAWGTRQDNTTPMDVRRDDFGFGNIDISELEIAHSRILAAVHQGHMINSQNVSIPLSDDNFTNGKRGIDILGDAFEADLDMSVNPNFYGDFHNLSHIVISFAHDPSFFHKEQAGVMSDSSTAMRDPVFYRLHKFVDNLFQEYKLRQSPYTTQYLSLEGVKINRAGVTQGTETNILRTAWNEREFEAGRGLDFNSEVPVQLKFRHLDHKPFNYNIEITNNLSSAKAVTVRIFLAPMRDERRRKMNFMDQRLLWAEMDKFTATLTPGLNRVVRSSKDSSITSPEELTFRQLEAGITYTPGTDEASEFGVCGCGWPQHMLLPRGTPQGMDYQLFFMLTDFQIDEVKQPASNRTCTNASSFCGILDGKYPDSRPMGFPFDRRHPPEISGRNIQTAEHFAGQLDNAMIVNIKIAFSNAMMQ